MKSIFNFSKSQLKLISDIVNDIAQISFGVLVIGQLVSKDINWPIFIAGLISTSLLWCANLILVRRIKI
jgi:hypothetical protein